jgi:hypothetical protein
MASADVPLHRPTEAGGKPRTTPGTRSSLWLEAHDHIPCQRVDCQGNSASQRGQKPQMPAPVAVLSIKKAGARAAQVSYGRARTPPSPAERGYWVGYDCTNRGRIAGGGPVGVAHTSESCYSAITSGFRTHPATGHGDPWLASLHHWSNLSHREVGCTPPPGGTLQIARHVPFTTAPLALYTVFDALGGEPRLGSGHGVYFSPACKRSRS